MKICFVGSLSTVFIKRDYEILKKHFDVDVIEPPRTIKEWLKYPFLVRNKVINCNIVFGWFAGWHTALPIFFSKKNKKKSVVVAGGYDVVYLPEINYGAFTSLKEKIPAKYVLKNSDCIVSISKSNQKELLEKITPKHNVLIYNGVPIDEFNPGNKEKENIAITVGGVKRSNLVRKGIEVFVKAAKLLPDTKFVVIGKFTDDSIEHLRLLASDNVHFTGFVSDEDLLKWYQRAKVYVQPSAHEGFGITVAESMLCECIPVVTDRFALPEVVGDTGFYSIYDNVEKTAEGINEALHASQRLAEKARERVIKSFSLERREERLVKSLCELYGSAK